MVLRGSKTRPEGVDILDVQHHIARLRNLLNSLEEQESDIEHEIANIIVKEVPSGTSGSMGMEQIEAENPSIQAQTMLNEYKSQQIEIPANLSDSIKVLIDRLEFLETKHQETEQELSESQKELQIMVKQFICGGIAGMTARTTVAPIDRVKLIIQTSLATKRVESGERGIIGTARHLISEGGIFSMWKGITY